MNCLNNDILGGCIFVDEVQANLLAPGKISEGVIAVVSKRMFVVNSRAVSECELLCSWWYIGPLLREFTHVI